MGFSRCTQCSNRRWTGCRCWRAAGATLGSSPAHWCTMFPYPIYVSAVASAGSFQAALHTLPSCATRRPFFPWLWAHDEPLICVLRFVLRACVCLAGASRTPCPVLRATRRRLSRGARVAPSRVFPVCLAAAQTALDRVRSATCAAAAACSRPPRSGASGTGRST